MELLQIGEILYRRRRIIIIVSSVFFLAVVIGTHLMTPVYEVRAKLFIGSGGTIVTLMNNLGLKGMEDIVPTPEESFETHKALATLRPLLNKIISLFDLKKANGKTMTPETLIEPGILSIMFSQPAIEVDQYEDASIIEIVSTSSDASEAVNMSNKLAELYQQDRIQSTREIYKATRLFVEGRIQEIKENYYKTLHDMRDFQVKEQTIDLNQETTNLLKRIDNLGVRREEIENQIISLEMEENKANEKLQERQVFRKESKQLIYNDQLRLLKTKLNDQLITLAERKLTLTESNIEYKIVKEAIKTINELMKNEAEIIFSSETIKRDPISEDLSKKVINSYMAREIAKVDLNYVEKIIKSHKNDLMNMSFKLVRDSKLRLPLGVHKAAYQNLLEYITKVGIAETVTISNIRLVESAEIPEKPEYPKKKLFYALGLLLGLFWGLGAGFLYEYIDNTIRTTEDIKYFKSLLMLGTLTKSKLITEKKLLPYLKPNSHVLEEFRRIRNNIKYASTDKTVKSILVTSSLKGEGKSAIAANLVISFSMEGKKTILLDLNFRKPYLHEFFDILNEKGITDVLTENLYLKDAIVKTKVEGVDLLPGGAVPTDPAMLIESQGLKDMIFELRKQYDVLILDTVPVLELNDALVLGNIVDGVLYVIESGKVTFKRMEHAIELMARANLNLTGVVLNKFKGYGPNYYGFSIIHKLSEDGLDFTLR